MYLQATSANEVLAAYLADEERSLSDGYPGASKEVAFGIELTLGDLDLM